MVGLFLVSFGALKVLALQLAPSVIVYQHLVHTLGGAVVGLITGYFLSGFLWCVLQTLPWQEKFMGFDTRSTKKVPHPLFLGLIAFGLHPCVNFLKALLKQIRYSTLVLLLNCVTNATKGFLLAKKCPKFMSGILISTTLKNLNKPLPKRFLRIGLVATQTLLFNLTKIIESSRL